MRSSTTAALAALTLCITPACFVRGGAGLFFLAADTAIITAAIVSSTRPPPPEVIYVPEPRQGYAWQPGYWTIHDDDWVWVNGRWLVDEPGAAWNPTHWEQRPDGQWELHPGRWERVAPPVQVQPPPPPGPPPPPPAVIPPPPPASAPQQGPVGM